MTGQIEAKKRSPKKTVRLTKTVVESLEITGERYNAFDGILKGFTVRVGAKGEKAFYLVYQAGKGRGAPIKWLRLGTFPAMTVEQARQLAKEKAADVTKGADPAAEVRESKAAPHMRELLETFCSEHVETKLKPKTRLMYRLIIDKHLVPALGKMKADDVEFKHVAKLHHAMRETPYQANRTLAVLHKFFVWAGKRGYQKRGHNPAEGIEKFKEIPRKIFMNADELALVAQTLDRMESIWRERKETKTLRKAGAPVDTITPPSAAAIRLLMLTGARMSEILYLAWENIDMEQGTAFLPDSTALLPDSKTGFKALQLNEPALAVLEALPRIDDKWVFPSTTASGHMEHLKEAWNNLMRQCGLKGKWRIHDLRHAFASVLISSGASLPIVGKILGHSQPATTARYAHLERNPAKEASEAAAAKIAETMKRPAKSGILQFMPKAEAALNGKKG